MNNELPAEWQAIADDIRSWYSQDARVVYQNAIDATVQRCYALANKNKTLLRPAVTVDVSQIPPNPQRPNRPMSAGAYERAIRERDQLRAAIAGGEEVK